jgi:galactokinase/mevalonate kinase-like predicted kinase
MQLVEALELVEQALSFFGGGSDCPVWYRRHGGAVLAATIDKHCYLTCRYLPPFFEHKTRIVHSQIENCDSRIIFFDQETDYAAAEQARAAYSSASFRELTDGEGS